MTRQTHEPPGSLTSPITVGACIETDASPDLAREMGDRLLGAAGKHGLFVSVHWELLKEAAELIALQDKVIKDLLSWQARNAAASPEFPLHVRMNS